MVIYMNESKKYYYLYKLVFNKVLKKYQVIGKDRWTYSEATNSKGAVQGALAIGIRLSDIDFNGNYVPIREVING